MPDFAYRMATADGATVEGAMSAADEVALAAQVRALGGVLISCKVRRVVRSGVRVDRRELITFTQHLHTTVQAGIPVLSAIRGYAKQAENPDLGRALNDLANQVEAGQSLSEAMATFPRIFPPLYVNMTAAGEASGKLDAILERLASYLEWRDEMARDLKQATVYPVVVISMVLGLIVFLLSFVLPRFIGIFDGATMELPLATRVLMAVGTLFGANWPWLAGATLLLALGFWLLKRHPRGAVWLHQRQIALPLFGKAIRFISLSQMTYSLGLLVNAGVNITQALALSRGAVTNLFLAERMAQVGERINAGESLTQAFSHSGQFPPLALQMIAVGEESGQLPESLDRVTQYLRREVQHGLRVAMKALEPAITLFLGVMVGGIALTIFYTLYKMIMAIGGTGH